MECATATAARPWPRREAIRAVLEPRQELTDEQGVVVIEAAGEFFPEVGDLAAQGAVREVGHHRRVTLPSDQSSEHLP